ncbi:MAG: hypothetical protein WD969_13695 [Paracoccaceae bacterium]
MSVSCNFNAMPSLGAAQCAAERAGLLRIAQEALLNGGAIARLSRRGSPPLPLRIAAEAHAAHPQPPR